MQHYEELFENLSPYERWQYEKYGFVLSAFPPYQAEEEQEYRMSLSEENYIFNLENPNP